MHETLPDGTVIVSRCDFCRAEFDAEPMVEGHQGSLICLKCLSTAYTDVVLAGGGRELAGSKCTMCLEHRDQPQWESPLHPEAHICLRCMKQAATRLEKDPDVGWRRPGAGDSAAAGEDAAAR